MGSVLIFWKDIILVQENILLSDLFLRRMSGKGMYFHPCLFSFAPVVGVECFSIFWGGKGVFLCFCAQQKNACGHPLQALCIGKKKHTKIKKHTYVFCVTVCLTSESCQQKKNAGKLQRNIKGQPICPFSEIRYYLILTDFSMW